MTAIFFHRRATLARTLVGACVAAMLSACAGIDTAPAPVSNTGAVVAFVDSAHAALADGRPEDAAATLERALRIEPRNPTLWHELAAVRLSQGQYEQAGSLATKSNALAGANKSLRARNWRLLAEVRAQAGDRAGAEAAQANADALEN